MWCPSRWCRSAPARRRGQRLPLSTGSPGDPAAQSGERRLSLAGDCSSRGRHVTCGRRSTRRRRPPANAGWMPRHRESLSAILLLTARRVAGVMHFLVPARSGESSRPSLEGSPRAHSGGTQGGRFSGGRRGFYLGQLDAEAATAHVAPLLNTTWGRVEVTFVVAWMARTAPARGSHVVQELVHLERGARKRLDGLVAAELSKP
ncbi:MAG: hypothetical protein SGPRY_011700 [Prymnesium sp.]